MLKSNKLLLLVILTTFTLGGCASYIGDGLNNLVGKQIKDAYASLGYPDAAHKLDVNKVFIWHSSESLILPVTNYTSSDTYGYRNYHYISRHTNYRTTHFQQFNYSCLIQIFTSQDDTILSWKYSGSNVGCSHYSSLLENQAKEYERKIQNNKKKYQEK